MAEKRAIFIVMEGIDSSGKATQTSLLTRWLEGEGLNVETFELPGESPAGRLIKRFLEGDGEELPSPEEFALLYAADRFHHLPRLKEALRSSDVVLFDRYTASNIAYQGARIPRGERDTFIEWLKAVERPLPAADLIIFLDVEPEVARRLGERRGRLDRNEEWLDYQREVYSLYLELSRGEKWERVKCTSSGDIIPPGEIHQEVKRRILKRYPELLSPGER